MAPPPRGPEGDGLSVAALGVPALGIAALCEGAGALLTDGAGNTTAGNRTSPEPTAIALPISMALMATGMRSRTVGRRSDCPREPFLRAPRHSGRTATRGRVGAVAPSTS